jgi:hypothetical protein
MCHGARVNAENELTCENAGAAILRFMPELQDAYSKTLNDYPKDSPPESQRCTPKF